jgi:ribonucleotide reductase alpha subunit
MAIAPHRSAIGIRRHFSTEGIHPYDEIVWERRDSRITDYRDGSVAFEQLDVEVPADWSVNATNILAQKYFRGTPGTPERETSLRQVADRVADTITEWGIKDGYFEDAAEAETFRDELKAIIVTQRAAFNSPVWFNIGVHGVPQQGSACQPYHALVSTPAGLVPIGALVESGAVGTKVFDAFGVTRVVAVKHNGRKRVLRIATRAGHQLDVTADHLVWKCSDEKYGRFVRAGELAPGDKLQWARNEAFGERQILAGEVAEAALAGWLQSDGFVGQYQGTNRSLTIEAITVTDAERQWVIDAIDSVFPHVHRHERRVETKDPRLDCRRIRLYDTDLASFVDKWSLRDRGLAMGVPQQLLTAPLPVVAAYLRSVFQAEGYVSTRDSSALIGLDMISEGIIRGIQSLLGRFGIFSRVRFKADRRADRKGCWSLTIRSLGDRIAFANEIGFIDSTKASKLEASLELEGLPQRPTKRIEIDRIEELGEMDVYDIQTESGEYLSDGIRVHNCFILSVDDSMDSILNWYREEGIIFKGGSGAGVNLSSIRASTERLQGGGTASGPVSFMRGADASAGTIKSGGKTRRAAKMVILNDDHPDIEDFIWCKATEERKARALRDAGFDMDLDGTDSFSIQYQNANNSVRVTDEFMHAVLDDADWALTARTDGSAVRVVKARDLFRQIAHAAWECADPGMQFDTTINRWHTAPNAGRINGSNPCCFVGETEVVTTEGRMRISDLVLWTESDQTLPTVTAFDSAAGHVVDRDIVKAWVSGYTAELVDVVTENGRLRCTPDHRFLTAEGGFVGASALSPGSRLRAIDGTERVVAVERVRLEAEVPVYDIEVEGVHNFAVSTSGSTGVIAHNSEYMHLDNSACNLASINLLKYLREDGSFDTEGFRATVDVVFTAQEIIVGNADYPTDKIAENSRRYRELGLGYANLGALLMAQGLPYDSEEGRAWAASITALMTGHAYAVSARTASRMGPFAGFHADSEAMIEVLRMHRAEVAKIDEELLPTELLSAAQEAWDAAVELGEEFGVRNAQASVLAPTGTIALLMDCDTTGVEPDLGLVKTKKLVGGGTMSIVNQTVPRALVRMGYTLDQVDDIVKYIDEHKSIVGAPHLAAEHLPVFACSMGDNTIPYMGHIRMMGAVQPFISGAISKCVVGETLLATDDGLVRIGSLHQGEAPDSFRDEVVAVSSLDGVQKTDAFYYGGTRRVRRAVLRSGHAVTGTPNHRLLVAGPGGLDWKRLDEIEVGDHVAVKYGDELWSPFSPRFDDFTPSARDGLKEAVQIPTEMTDSLAFFLGAYASEGGTARSTWTVRVTNADDEVLAEVAGAARAAFGVAAPIRRPAGRCPYVELSSKTVVEFLEYLGCGADASAKRIPDAILRSCRAHVVSFLQGLALEASVTTAGGPTWAIRLDAPALLDDLQAVLTNLGVVHGRTTEDDPIDGESGDEVYARGEHARRIVEIAPFLESGKRARAARLLAAHQATTHDTADAVPGITPAELYALVPDRARNEDGVLRRSEFGFLADPRTTWVTRPTLERVARIPGVVLPHWLVQVLGDNLHFSPVACVEDAGEREVYDVSVPATHAFVGNGIVNHNTVNMPESVTVEDIEQLHMDAWKLGIKAVAIYRDNCKVAQPLSTTKKTESGDDAPAGSEAEAHNREMASKIAALEAALAEEQGRARDTVVVGAVRERLPKRRKSSTFSFRVADCEGYVTVGEYDDGRPGEVFIKVSKQGSTLAGIMDAFSISVSLGLQHGVPLATYVRKYSNMRFEPAGITDDAELRIATSLIDYIFRRLALDYLPRDEREELGVLSTVERVQPTLPGVEEAATPGKELVDDAGVSNVPPAYQGRTPSTTSAGGAVTPRAEQRDAPLCYQCGMVMQRAGSCYVCSSCGTTSGCS